MGIFDKMFEQYGDDGYSSDPDFRDGYDPSRSDAALFDFSKEADIHTASDEALMAVYEKELGLEQENISVGRLNQKKEHSGFSLDDDLFLPKPLPSLSERLQSADRALTGQDAGMEQEFE